MKKKKQNKKEKAWRLPTQPEDDKVNKRNLARGRHLSNHSKKPIKYFAFKS